MNGPLIVQRNWMLYFLLFLGAAGAAGAFIQCVRLEGLTEHCLQVGTGAFMAYFAPSPIRYDRLNGFRR